MSGSIKLKQGVSAVLAAAMLATMAAFPGKAYANDYQNPSLPVEQRVADLLGRMTLQEKVGQMLQVERLAATPAQVGANYIGSVLSGGGSNPSPNTKESWASMVNGYQAAAVGTRLGIPILYGVDAVHGHNNVYGATIFPHNVGLGATGDEDLLRRIGAATAREIRATGIQWDFAPCLCAPQDIRWGRTYEGYSEDSALVARLGTAFVEGLQGRPGEAVFLKGTKAVGTIKHWLGDGNTTAGDDQGNVTLTESALDPYIQPYREAIAAGARSVMISLTTWNGAKMHADPYLVTTMLKQGLGFDGMVVSDWNGAYSLVNQGVYPNYSEALKATVNAGIDMFMEPDNWTQFIPTLTALVNGEHVSHTRINDAVSRILKVKFEAGLFEAPYGDPSLLTDGSFGGAEHRALAREAVRKSAVLLKNEGKLLPLSKNAKVFVAGSKASDIGTQSGGWTISWQGSSGAITPGTTILQGIQGAVTNAANVTYSANGMGAAGHDAAIVVVGEAPSAEMMGDVGPGQPRPDLNLGAADQAALANVLASGVPTAVVMLSGRPMTIGGLLPNWEAFVAAWLPGTEGAGVADVLFGDYDFTGKLPFTWPRDMAQIPANFNDTGYSPLFPLGYGLNALATGVRELPGAIEAENFNASFGVQTEAATDASGGLNVGFIDAGDWMDYRVFAPVAGSYRLRVRVASGNAGGAPNAVGVASGGTSLATLSVPGTGGWQSWTTVQETVALAAGTQTLRLSALAGGWNANWLELIPVSAAALGNLLANPGFESGGAAGWNEWNGGVAAQSVDTDIYDAGYVADLTGQPFVGKLYEAVTETVKYDGKVAALPLESLSWGYLYNKTIFKEQGLTPPQTLDEMKAVTEKLQAAGIKPFLLAFQESWIPQLMMALSLGGTVSSAYPDWITKMNEGTASYADVRSVFDIIDMIMANGTDKPFETGNEAGSAEFANGNAAMWVQGSWNAETILKVNPDMDFGVAPLPVSNNPADAMINLATSTSLALSPTSENKEVALDLLNYILDDKDSSALFEELKFNPIATVHQYEVFPWVNEASAYVSEGKAYLDLKLPNGVTDETAKLLQSYYIKDVTQDDIIAALDKVWQTAVKSN